VAHRFRFAARSAYLSFLVPVDMAPVLPDQVGSVYCFVQELLYDRSNRLFPHVLPYRSVGFYFSSYSFYGHAGEL